MLPCGCYNFADDGPTLKQHFSNFFVRWVLIGFAYYRQGVGPMLVYSWASVVGWNK